MLNLNMDYTVLLLLLLNLSGAICAVVQWKELNEAKVRHSLLCNLFKRVYMQDAFDLFQQQVYIVYSK